MPEKAAHRGHGDRSYGPAHAEVYDAVFRSRGKDFDQEATQVLAVARERIGDPQSLLDVACGTGAHLKTYGAHVPEVAGIDLSPHMLAVAKRHLPGIRLQQEDMCSFNLNRRYDVVVSLGNSIACTASPAQLDLAIERMAAHTAEAGLTVVEPWFFPENFIDGHVGGHVLVEADRAISRVTRSTRVGGFTRHQVQFTVSTSRSGIHSFAEELVVQLLNRERWELAFQRAGLAVEFLPPLELDGRPNGPGLFVARFATTR